jgi:hypothetical protein
MQSGRKSRSSPRIDALQVISQNHDSFDPGGLYSMERETQKSAAELIRGASSGLPVARLAD